MSLTWSGAGAVVGDGEGFHSDSWVGMNNGEAEAPARLMALR